MFHTYHMSQTYVNTVSLLAEPLCKRFELTSTGGTKLYKPRGLGAYELQNYTRNGRVVYFNEETTTYLRSLRSGDWIVRNQFMLAYNDESNRLKQISGSYNTKKICFIT